VGTPVLHGAALLLEGLDVKGQAALMSSARTGENEQDCWQTPEEVLELVREVAPINLDPCTTRDNPTRAQLIWTDNKFDDALNNWWPGEGLVYINPPYSQMAAWAKKLAYEVKRSGMRREYIALLPARTDTRWWHELVEARPARVCFWKGRLKFNRPDGTPGQSAPFPSALLYYGADDQKFAQVFGPKGWVVRT
jgi:phage N-6-adenine-methyltransferase